MQILPQSFAMKLIRRDDPERATGHIHRLGSNDSNPGPTDYTQAPALTQLANDLSKLDQVRSERVTEVEQRLRNGAYGTLKAIDETAQIMLDQLTGS